MAIVEWEKDESVAIVKLNNGGNPQNLAFADALNKTLEEIIEDKSTTAMVLTSSDSKIFSTGVDVDWVTSQMQENNVRKVKDFMLGMNSVFAKLLTYPIPTIAAINGHAFGNGAILSCACDFRFMRSDRGYFCFPEVDVGIPFLPGMIAFIRKAIPEYKFNEICLSGRRVTAPELEEHNIIEKACPNIDELMSESIAYAKTFVKKRGIFAELKKRLYRHIIEIMENKDIAVLESSTLFVKG
ncbi:MAG: enoyl-CoA hydratase/isomerase family protein [Desulfobacterales bacterium]|jgi:enoyl-CoA hydratase/carnithine racemase|nr:enoyl-CoA hydratase/isomerase family protein [Desulfobacteraceae bacterium]MBT4364900.1 enoyl-CoA hydratase/isomerase family protein [Desulfobacteraceae bacterium]MBT7086556.1 enoyl-CoA hydratase/isomerase family protein [Desulfobacterales bacterium]